MRNLTCSLLACAGFAFSSLPAEAQVTTRIETRPAYGATVTLEHGVRVYRPLPPQDRVIINPGGKTPLYLSIGDGGVYGSGSNSYSEAYAGRNGPGVGGGGALLPRGHHPHGRRGH